MDKIEEGGTGLKYSEERTVYLTEIPYGDGDYTLEITEEERAYNIETVEKFFAGIDDEGKPKIFISYYGVFYPWLSAHESGDNKEVQFGRVVEEGGQLFSLKVTVSNNGDAIAISEVIQTGGSEAPSDMNSDFSNDF